MSYDGGPAADEVHGQVWDCVYLGETSSSLAARLSPVRWLRMLQEDVRACYQYRYVLQSLVSTQVRLRYHRSVLGFCWTFLNPMLLLTVQAIAFSHIMRMHFHQYVLFLFSGLIPWHFFSASVDSASRSLIANEGLIRKIAAPKFLFPLADVLVGAVNLLFSLPALFLFFLLFRHPVDLHVLLLVPGLLLLLLFTFGLALIAMTLGTFFRDFTHMTGVLLMALYFLSPILYPPAMLAGAADFLAYNPMSYFMDLIHCAFFDGSLLYGKNFPAQRVWPPASIYLIAAGFAAAAVVTGYVVYKANEREYIHRL